MSLPCHTDSNLYVNSLLTLFKLIQCSSMKFLYVGKKKIGHSSVSRELTECGSCLDDSSNDVQYSAQREDKSCTFVCIPMVDGTPGPIPQEHHGSPWESSGSRSKRVITILVLAFIFMAAGFLIRIDIFPKFHQRLQREEHLTFDIVGNNAILRSQPLLYRSSFHFQPPKNWMNGKHSLYFLITCSTLGCGFHLLRRISWCPYCKRT